MEGFGKIAFQKTGRIDCEAAEYIKCKISEIRNFVKHEFCVEKVSEVLDEIEHYLFDDLKDRLVMTSLNGRSSSIFHCNQISVIETDGRFLKAYMYSGERYIISKMSLSDILLKWPGVFIRANRNVIVNISAFKTINKADGRFEVSSSGYPGVISVSRRSVRLIKDLVFSSN
jgi:DNA-binding LytR/AlgR family response regulator